MATTIISTVTDLTLALSKAVLFRVGAQKTTYATGLTMGGGFCYILEKKKYEDLGLVFLFPVGYAGYHLMKNRDTLGSTMRKEFLSYKSFQQNDIDKKY